MRTSTVAAPPELRVAALSADEIRLRLERDPTSLGSLSVGHPNRGRLWNGVLMPESPFWEVLDPKHSFGTEEAVTSVTRAIDAVNEQYPDSPRLYVGQLSAEHGGYLRPHRSHQNGRDVDLGYYYRGGARWYARATAKNLDLERTWALLKALAGDPNVEVIFMDRSVQRLLRAHALDAGEAPGWVDGIFESRARRDTLVRHAWGHATHLHVRFRSSRSSEAGETACRELIALRMIPPRRYY